MTRNDQSSGVGWWSALPACNACSGLTTQHPAFAVQQPAPLSTALNFAANCFRSSLPLGSIGITITALNCATDRCPAMVATSQA